MEPDRSRQPEVMPQDNIDVAKPVRLTMDNGIQLNLITAGGQDVVRLDVVFRGGSWHQTQKLQAIFTNRMLREGTRKYTAAQISEKLDYYGAWLDLSSSSEHAFITLYSLNKYFAQTLEVLESVIKEPVFPEEKLQTVMQNNLQQFRINSAKVDFVAHRSLMTTIFGNEHPLGSITTEEDYGKVTRDTLMEFYNTNYCSANCMVFLSGKTNAAIEALVHERLGSTPFGQTCKPVVTKPYVPHPADARRIFTPHNEAMQSSVKLAALSIAREHADNLKFRVLVTLFGGYFGSRLMSNIREDKGYTYGISAALFNYPSTGLLVVSSETTNESVEPLIREVYNEMSRLQQEPVSPEELELVRNYMIGEMSRSFESPFSLADAWIFTHTANLGDDYFNQSLRAIQQVTPRELQELACKHLQKENLKEIIVGKNIS